MSFPSPFNPNHLAAWMLAVGKIGREWMEREGNRQSILFGCQPPVYSSLFHGRLGSDQTRIDVDVLFLSFSFSSSTTTHITIHILLREQGGGRRKGKESKIIVHLLLSHALPLTFLLPGREREREW